MSSDNSDNSQRARAGRRGVWLALFVAVAVAPAEAYIGPGAGFAIASSFLTVLATMALAVLGLLLWPINWLIRAIRGRRTFARAKIKRLVVLGLDGLEQSLVEKFIAAGKMPNLKRLREMGGYSLLETTIPPLSPVAWSTFLTGSNPGKHNIYDFLNSDRRTYLPHLSSVDIRPPTKTMKLGKYEIPLNKPEIRLMRKGKPFWNTLGEHGIFSSVIRVPITFPPQKCRGVVLSAMCAPDLRGTQGLFSFYSTRSDDDTERTGGEQIRVQRAGDTVRSELVGPENSVIPGSGHMTVPFEVHINGDRGTLRIEDKEYALDPGVYTPWITVSFKAGLGVTVSGVCRFLLVRTAPEFELYVMPINIDPENAAMPISYPVAYGSYLAKRYGTFATLGLAEDTWALNEDLIEDQAFVDQCLFIDAEREKQFFDALDNTGNGLVVCVFDGTDRLQHMFWRYLEDDHPANPKNLRPDTYKPNGSEKVLVELYERMDVLVGETMRRTIERDENTMLMVISDHGFCSFRRGIDLNAWLIENGYMVLKPDAQPGAGYLQSVDWSKTRAYTLGLAGMFINQKGREKHGIVEAGVEAQKVKDEIIAQLTGLKDPQNGELAIRRVFDKNKAYHGPYRDTAPDLIIGYNKGYRVAWDTAVGKVTDSVFHDNDKAWSGDHCIDPELIPGVFFCSHPIESESPRLMDLGPTALSLFGVDVPANMDGKPLKIAVGNGRGRKKGKSQPAVAAAG